MITWAHNGVYEIKSRQAREIRRQLKAMEFYLGRSSIRLFIIAEFFASAFLALQPEAFAADVKASFLSTWKTPTILTLQNFKKNCEPNGEKLDFSSDTQLKDLLAEARVRSEPIRIRALIHATSECTADQSRVQLLDFLGVRLLTNHPKLVIHGLYNEKNWEKLSALLADALPAQYAGADCSASPCMEERQRVLQKKREALEKAKIRKIEERIRKRLLADIESGESSAPAPSPTAN